MFTDTITYEDFNGNTLTQEIYFNISKMEAIELDATYPGGYGNMLQSVVDSDDNLKIFNAFKDIVKKSYGVKSDDGKRFVKSDEVFEEFESSPVYDEFMIKLMSEEDYALNFILGTLPNTDGITKESVLSEINKNNKLNNVSKELNQ